MKLSTTPTPIFKPESVIRLRLQASNSADEPRTITVEFAGHPVVWTLQPKSTRRLGPQGGFCLPHRMPVVAKADGPDVSLTIA
jgi:hypothetical protein